VRKVYLLHFRSVGSDGQKGRLKAMREPLRESKCENGANETSDCTINHADVSSDASAGHSRPA
jgi:hypothetical protein